MHLAPLLEFFIDALQLLVKPFPVILLFYFVQFFFAFLYVLHSRGGATWVLRFCAHFDWQVGTVSAGEACGGGCRGQLLGGNDRRDLLLLLLLCQVQVAHVSFYRVAVYRLLGSIQLESFWSKFRGSSICLRPIHAWVLFSRLAWIDSLNCLDSSTVAVSESASLLHLNWFIYEGLGALHCVGDRLRSVDQLITHVLVLLHCLVVRRHAAQVALLRYWLFLFKTLVAGSSLLNVHNVYLVVELAFFARFRGWTCATALAAYSLNTTHLACNRRVLVRKVRSNDARRWALRASNISLSSVPNNLGSVAPVAHVLSGHISVSLLINLGNGHLTRIDISLAGCRSQTSSLFIRSAQLVVIFLWVIDARQQRLVPLVFIMQIVLYEKLS